MSTLSNCGALCRWTLGVPPPCMGLAPLFVLGAVAYAGTSVLDMDRGHCLRPKKFPVFDFFFGSGFDFLGPGNSYSLGVPPMEAVL